MDLAATGRTRDEILLWDVCAASGDRKGRLMTPSLFTCQMRITSMRFHFMSKISLCSVMAGYKCVTVCLCVFMVVDLDSQDGHLSSKIFIGDRTSQQPAVCCPRAQVFVCCQTFEGTCCQMTGEVGCPANLRLWQLLLRLPDVPIVLMLPLLFSHSQK